MSDEKMTFSGLKLLERDLHRELTDDEAAVAFAHGIDAVLEGIGMTGEKYKNYKLLIELISTYYTKDFIDFEKLLHSKDFSGAYQLLLDFVIASTSQEIGVGGFDLGSDEDCEDACDEVCEEEESRTDDGFTLAEGLAAVFAAIPECESEWVEDYVELDPDFSAISKFISDLIDDEEDHFVEEEIGNALDIIKDTVVEKTAAKIAESGDSVKLREDLLNEVVEYVEENWTNYSMRIVNNIISIKKF